MASNRGCIWLSRRFLRSQIRSLGPEYADLWVAILLSVNWQPGWFKGVRIDPGQMAFGWRTVAERLYPPEELGDATPSHNTVRKRILRLETIGKIRIEELRAPGVDKVIGSLLTVENWQKYQPSKGKSVPKSGTHPGTHPGTDQRRGRRGISNTSAEADSVDFDEFWNSYPVRVLDSGKRTKGNKQKAVDQWKRLSPADRDLAKRGAIEYARNGQRPKDCVRWIRDRDWEQWLDETTSSPSLSSSNGRSPRKPSIGAELR